MRRSTYFPRNGLLIAYLTLGLLASILSADGRSQSPSPAPPPVRYAPEVDDRSCRMQSQKALAPSAAPYEEYYRCKIDFARLEHEFPLTPDDVKKITPENLTAATQEQVDQIYARLTAGPIPDGAYEIRFFRSAGGAPFEAYARLAGEQGTGLALLLSQPMFTDILPSVWRAKVFDANHKIVRTRIGNVGAVPDRLKQIFPEVAAMEPLMGREPGALLLPAKVYCGQSLLDGRRESIIMDYAFSRQIPGYRENIDSLTGPRRLHIRDEIRMVRPGFYLGRTYMGRIFVLNFTLYRKPVAKRGAATVREACRIGSQQMTAASK